MVDRTNIQLPPPSNWQDFERLCQHLFREMWKDRNTQQSGRLGQPQYGVDVYGLPQGDQRYAGVQCKGKDARFGQALTVRELNDEVEKAKSFDPPLGSFIVATTAKTDANIQAEARRLTLVHRTLGLFDVAVWGWEEVHAGLSEFPNVLRTHYPQHFPEADESKSTDGLEPDGTSTQSSLDDYTFIHGAGEQIARTRSRDKEGRENEFVYWHRAPTAWLRLIPSMPKAYGLAELRRLLERSSIPLLPFGTSESYRLFPNGRGVVVLGFDGDLPETIATRIAQVSQTGEIWAHNRTLVEVQSESSNARLIPWPAMKQEFESALANYMQIAQLALNLTTPITFVAGLALVDGAEFVRQKSVWFGEHPKRETCWRDFVPVHGTINAPEMLPAQLLDPFYRAVFDACGLAYEEELRSHIWPKPLA